MNKPTKYLIIALIASLVLYLCRIKAIIPAILLGLILVSVLVTGRKKAGDKIEYKKGNINLSQAKEILGLRDGHTEQDIKDAYNKLIKVNHPDQGGSEYIAAQLNEAKEILLKEMKKKLQK